MLGRRNQHAFFHQAGGVADAGDVAAGGLDPKTVQVDAAKHNARTGGGGQNPQMDRGAAVQTYTGTFRRPTNCLLVFQSSGSYLLLDEEIIAWCRKYGCGNLATVRGYLPTPVGGL